MDRTNPSRFFVTHTQDLQTESDGSVFLEIWQYAEGTQSNQIIGELTWKASMQKGHLQIGIIEPLELSLRDCH